VVCVVEEGRQRQVSFEEGRILADSLGASYFEVSLEAGTNCEDLFSEVANQLIDMKQKYMDDISKIQNEWQDILSKLGVYVCLITLSFYFTYNTIWMSLYALLSVIFFSNQYSICQTDELPKISLLPLWLSFGCVVGFGLFLIFKKMSYVKRMKLITISFYLAVALFMIMLVLTGTEVLCAKVIESILRVVFIFTALLSVLVWLAIGCNKWFSWRKFRKYVSPLEDARED